MPKVGAIDVELGKRLRFFREQNRFSQERLAREIGVVFQQVQKYETGVNRISCARLLKILSVLNISIVDFFAGISVDEKVLVTDAELLLLKGFRRKEENVRRAILMLLQ